LGTILNKNSESADSGIWIAIAPRKVRRFIGFFNQHEIELTEERLVAIVDEIRRMEYQPVRRINHDTSEFAYWIGTIRILIRVTAKSDSKWVISRIMIHARQEGRGDRRELPLRRHSMACCCH